MEHQVPLHFPELEQSCLNNSDCGLSEIDVSTESITCMKYHQFIIELCSKVYITFQIDMSHVMICLLTIYSWGSITYQIQQINAQQFKVEAGKKNVIWFVTY
jgi:hypothetical protein